MKKFAGKTMGLGLSVIMAVGMAAGVPVLAQADEEAGTVIEFFNQKTEIVDILEGLIDEYEEANPDVHIELVTPADATTVLSTRMASDDTPDVFTQWPNKTFFTQVDSGYVADLSDTGIMDNVQDVARDAWKYNDGEYAATVSYNCSGVWYNKDLFKQAGIENVPVTWDELIEDCEKLKAAGITPFVTVGKETSITVRVLDMFLASCMGEDYDAFSEASGSSSFDTEASYADAVEKMGEKMLQMLDYSQDDVIGTDQDSATANFANGEGAMMVGGSWLLASVTAANPDINIAMMPIPGDTAESTNTCAYPGDFSLCIAENSDVKDAAIDFVKWMTSTETAEKYTEAEGNPSCIKGVDYTAEQFSDLYADYVTTGKFILNPDVVWSSAQTEAAGAAIQQLYYEKDASQLPEYLASAYNDN